MTGSSGVVGNDSYRCYADITTLVNTHRSGFYGCASIPCTTVPTATIEQGGGYIFAIVTSNPKYSATGISLNLSNDNFGQIGTNIPIITPTSGSVNGSLAVGVIEASATNGDGLKVQNVYPVSGTFRPPGNFFNALISDNSGTGAVYTNATFGTRNQNGVAFSNMVGGRQGLDLAIFPIPSGAIPANSTTYFMDGDSVGITPPGNDRTLYMLYGSAILPSAALPNITKSVDKGLAQGGDVLYYTLSVALGGTGTVNNLIIYDSLPNSVTMIPNSVAVNGVTVPGANLVTGLQLFPVVTLPMTSTVTFAVSINTPATVDSVPNTYTTTYRNPVSNGTIYTTTIVSNIALTTIVAAPSFELTKM